MMERPTQAVILAGGRGSRLRPLTDLRPKPMIEVHDRPFLDYLIEELRSEGFTRVLLLVGYLGDVIIDHYRANPIAGVDIIFDHRPEEFDTGARLRAARDKIDNLFLLLYCDNYWPMQFANMWKHYVERNKQVLLTVYDNKRGLSKSNVALDLNGDVKVYDKSRQANELNYVDIGFLILPKSVLTLLDGHDNPSFESITYPQLVAKRQLTAFRTGHRYYSVGSPDRLAATEKILSQRKVILLDRDGVLNTKMPKASYVRSYDEWTWCEGALDALRLLKTAGYTVILVTNQAGISRDMLSEDDLLTLHRAMVADVRAAGGDILSIYFCPHHWNGDCDCRKPKPGMLFDAQHDHNLNLKQSLFVGDDERDGIAAQAASMPFARVSEGRALIDIVRELIDS